jgi:hypothetical protein
MKDNNPTLCALRRLHAKIGGEIIDSRKNIKRLREDRRHVTAVIKMFSPGYDTRTIAARRTYKANPWFKRGTLFRSALDIMRRTAEPLTVRQIVDRLLAAKGIASPRTDQVRGMQSAILASLQHRKGKGLIVGEGAPARWRLKEAANRPYLEPRPHEIQEFRPQAPPRTP